MNTRPERSTIADTAKSRDPQGWSTAGTLAIAAAGISALAFVALLVAVLVGVEHVEEGGHLLGAVLWSVFAIGALVALVLGLVAFFVGRSNHRPAEKRAGLLAIDWFLTAVILILIILVFT